MKNRRELIWPILALLLLFACALAAGSALAEQGSEPNPAKASGMLLEVSLERARSYPRQPVAITVTLLSEAQQVRNIEYPRLQNPAFLLGEFGPPRQRSVVREGRDYTAHEFVATLTPIRSGEFLVGPVELSCELLAPAAGPAAFFGGTEARQVALHSLPVPLTVSPLPLVGRPEGFSGAVGSFSVSRSARPTAVQAGDPVTVRTVIRGTGNLQAFPCSPISGPELQNYPPKRDLKGDSLVCEQVVIPQSSAVREIPRATLAFFDPTSERYRNASSAPVVLRIVEAPPGPVPFLPLKGRGPVPPQSHAAPVPALWPVATGAALLLAAVLGAGFLVRRRQRSLPACADSGQVPVNRSRMSEAEAALAAGDADALYTAIFRTLQWYLGCKLDLPAPGITAARGEDRCADPLLQPASDPLLPRDSCHPVGRHPDLYLQSASELLLQCDRVRYGRYQPGNAEMSADLQRLHQLS